MIAPVHRSRMMSRGGDRVSRFPNPYADIASREMPDTMPEILLWCEFIVLQSGIYAEALGRIVSYFLTEVQVMSSPKQEVDAETKDKWEKFLNDDLGIKATLKIVMMDYMVYGNSFVSVRPRFRRHIVCPKCRYEAPLRNIAEDRSCNFKWADFKFHARCPHCKTSGEWKRQDRKLTGDDSLFIRRWNPHEMEVKYSKDSGRRSYVWKIPEADRRAIRDGFLTDLENEPWEVIECVAANDNMLFADGEIYHMFEEPLAGVETGGWGLPKTLTVFRDAWHLQILNRANEAVGLTRIVPKQFLMPAARNGETGGRDPYHTTNMAVFVNTVQRILKQQMLDPAMVGFLPFSVEELNLGGDATMVAPKDLIDLAERRLLSAIGMPVEMFQGTLNINAAPASIRMMESNHASLSFHINRWLNAVGKKAARAMKWEYVPLKLKPPSLADDLNRQMARLQLMSSGDVSRQTGLEAIGVNSYEEQQRKLDEQKYDATQQEAATKEMEQSQLADQLVPPPPMAPGGAPPGAAAPPAVGGAPPPAAGAPPPAGPPPAAGMPTPGAMMSAAGGTVSGPPTPTGPPTAAQAFSAQAVTPPMMPQTPDEWLARADTIAQQILGMNPSERKSALLRLNQVDSTMHALVKDKLEEYENAAAQQGQQMVLDQQFPKQAVHRRPAPVWSARQAVTARPAWRVGV